ncbi:MAG: ATP-binding protein [Myxococcota bacterium]
MLNRDHVAELFPFFFRLDDAGRLRDLGASLRKVVPDAEEGSQAEALFLVKRSALRLDPAALREHLDQLVLLESRESGVMLRGRFLEVEGRLAFFGSPWFRELAELEGRGLAFSDFALHDPMPDTLVLLQAVAASLRDTARLAERLRGLRDEAERANQAKTDFLAVMSHEIRTPLNVVLGMTELLADTPLDDDQRRYVDAVEGNSEMLLRLISNVLDVSKLEGSQLDLERAPFDPRRLVDDVVAGFGPRARAKGLALRFEADEALPTRVLGDAARTRQVLLNLLGNALKFTHAGAVAVRLSSTPVDDEHVQLRLEVEDTGIGIAEEKLGAIFDRFVQASSSTTRRFGGSGLGLHIARSLVELMGGELGVRSRVGEGTCFTLDLRLEHGDPTRDSRTVVRPPGDVPLAAPLEVLVVEDTPDNRTLMGRFLAREGCGVTLACHGAEALERLEELTPDLILMDVEMPVMDGLACAAAIREREAREGRPRVPIVALTAHALRGFRERCLEAGMDAFLTKPLQRAQLRATLHRWGPKASRLSAPARCSVGRG